MDDFNLKNQYDRITTEFATLQYPESTLRSLHVPVLLLRLRLTFPPLTACRAGVLQRTEPTPPVPFSINCLFLSLCLMYPNPTYFNNPEPVLYGQLSECL